MGPAEKELEIESLGSLKKAKCFSKNAFCNCKNGRKCVFCVCHTCAVCALCVLRALRAWWFQCFAVVFASRRCFGLSLQLIVLLRFEANFEFQKCAVTSSSFRRYRV